MSTAPDPILLTRTLPDPDVQPRLRLPAFLRSRRFVVGLATTLILLAILATASFFYARRWLQTAVRDSLPQLDGSLAIAGLSAPVTVQRDAHGVPHIVAASIDDLVLAQGFVTAQDRLFQMDLLRRHAAGELAEVIGPAAVAHDRLQRTLQIRAAASRAIAQLPPAQLHLLTRYAAGVNASIAAQSAHLPVEFRILRYQPEPWTPRDSLLVLLAEFQDLTNAFPVKLARESLVGRLPPALRPQLEQDLYPVGSWRDHPPTTPIPDLTIEGPPIEDVPLDESQASLALPSLLAIPYPLPPTPSLVPGSNNWAVSGAHTASGKPLLSNDMHLTHSLPGLWYEADLEAQTANPKEPFHAAGVSLPGIPLIVVGHNNHIAWGLTNLGADVQDIYIETTRGTGQSEEFLATDDSWQPVVHLPEPIKVHGARTIPFEVLATQHGDALTPILNPVLTSSATQPGGPKAPTRTLALRWTIYDPSAVQLPTLDVDSAHDWPSFLAAIGSIGGPAQNVVYADDQGHIGFHAMGKIPLRGPAPQDTLSAPFIASSSVSGLTSQSPNILTDQNALNPTADQPPQPPVTQPLSGPLSPVPLVPTPAHEWSGYIPFDQLPQIYDPTGGVVATANSRTAPDDYAYPITLDWAAPYRNERIWRLLARRRDLKPSDMLAIQTDIYSEFDKMLAERLTYALDHSLAHPQKLPPATLKTLHQAADLLRAFDGRVVTTSAAASILSAVHATLWPMLLEPRLENPSKSDNLNALYVWGERDSALEQILMHQPPRWLPRAYPDWNDFLTGAVLHALNAANAPADLATWRFGSIHTVDIEHPIFDQSELLRRLIAMPTGTGPQPQSGDGTTIKQVSHTFGPSERFTADFANLDRSTLNIVLGQSGNPMSPWFLDQFALWLHGTTLVLAAPATHTLTLTPP